MQEIKFIKAQTLKEKPDESTLGFGKYFTDYMFTMDYTEGEGWHSPTICPYGAVAYEPSLMVYHYGQTIFEGLKAYKNTQGKPVMFRPMENLMRLNRSAERVCIPQIDVDFVLYALKKLVALEKDWIPTSDGTSLYIRPFIMATDAALGVHPSHTYRLYIILSPVGRYYKEGLKPVKIYVSDKYVRAFEGGLGAAKTAANYAASLYGAEEAQKKGYTQVLWLDGKHHKYVEEVGTMNIMFKIGDTVVTPALDRGSILPGITRKSAIQVIRDMGYKVEEREITIDEVYEAFDKGLLTDVFGTGTAAVISPVGILTWGDRTIDICNGEITPFTKELYDRITNIQLGIDEDKFSWIEPVEE
ncbi:MAG: branched-chain amino acid aminotransferase [Clostridiales bacterium]|nr:branched-chain amino acid aminotransferase [Clostridiales bacterium]